MKLELRELSADDYARQVLPLTHEIWGGDRTQESYAGRVLQLSATPYGKKHYRTLALTGGTPEVLASFKRYERAARLASKPLRAIGIGAVFTPPEHRGRGYASAMIGLELDRERKAGADFAFLFSNIHPQFYKQLGFVELPSRSFSVRVDSLEWRRLIVEPVPTHDWSAVRACFKETAASRTWSFERSTVFWSWIRTMNATQLTTAQRVDLVVRRLRTVVAYVLGCREPREDVYVVDEFGFIDDAAKDTIPALLRYAAGDLQRVAGWLPPEPARSTLPRGSVRRRKDAICMAAPLSPAGRALVALAQERSSGDPLWSTDHI